MSATATWTNPLQGFDHQFGKLTLVLSTAAINVLSLALPVATLQIYDRVLHIRNLSSLEVLLAGVLIAVIVETFLRLTRAYILTLRGATFVHGLSCDAMSAQLVNRAAGDGRRTVASEISDLGAIKNLKDFCSGGSVVTTVDLMFVPLYIGVMAYISQSLVLVPLGLLCAFSILTAYNGLRIRRRLDDARESDEQRYEFLINSLGANGVLKAFAVDRLLQRRFERFHESSCRTSYQLSKTISQSFVYGTVLGNLMTAATITAGAYMAVAGQLTIGALIAVVILSSRLMQPVQKAVLSWIKYQDVLSAQNRVNRLFAGERPEYHSSELAPANTGRIDISGLSYRTSPSAPLLLDGIDLSLERGTTLSLDGPPGSGKTVLLKLISGMLLPTDGKIRVNGIDPADLEPAILAEHVGYLSPRAKLFRGTIRDNLTRFGQVPSAQALEVAEHLGLGEEFARLPLGIDTVVGGELNATMTPGIEQMICFARAISTKPRIILFDEADSGLDAEHYNALLSLLSRIKNQVAMIVVSRDLNVRQLADRSVFINDGQLIETGGRLQRFLPIETRL